MSDLTNKIASRFLGKKSKGSEFYDPSLLVVVPRDDNRVQYHLDSTNLPFDGFDVWHAYEFSCMTEKGLPVTRLMKMKYSCNSKYLVESKSLKLYLNSFNMSSFGSNISECLEVCKNMIQDDLSLKLLTPVWVDFLDENVQKNIIFDKYSNILNSIDEKSLVVEKFNETPELLEVDETVDKQNYYLSFDSLRSNCRVTHQPDFGDAFIFYSSKKHIKEDSLVKYLCSFRCEYHFHEECCEMIFKRLSDILELNDELVVSILYTRRGGIDICPVRWSKNSDFNDVKVLLDVSKFARKSIKQ